MPGVNSFYPRNMSLANLNGQNGFKFTGFPLYPRTERTPSFASGGDINGDGIPDMIFGVPNVTPYGHGPDGPSKVFVMFGCRGDYSAELHLTTLDGSNGFVITEVNASGPGNVYGFGDWAGYSVAMIGDFNRDGFGDFAIGAPGGQVNSRVGYAYVIYGRSIWNATFDLTTLDGSNGFLVKGRQDADGYNGQVTDSAVGEVVAAAGDVNGDGFPDLLIGAPRSYFSLGSGVNGEGFCVLLYGGSGPRNASFHLNEIAPGEGTMIYNLRVNSAGGFGDALGSGDFNHDGYSDVVIGWPYQAGGRVFALFGRPDWPVSLGVDTTYLNGTNGFYVYPASYSGSNIGLGMALTSVDLNGDGISDLIATEPYVSRAVVVYGRRSDWQPVVYEQELNGTDGFRINCYSTRGFGQAVSSVGDFNRDGFEDFILGAEIASESGQGIGQSVIIFGGAEPFPAVLDFTDANYQNRFFTVNGAFEDDYSGQPVVSVGDLNGDGAGDVLMGAFGPSTGNNPPNSNIYAAVVFGIPAFETTTTTTTITTTTSTTTSTTATSTTISTTTTTTSNDAVVPPVEHTDEASSGSFPLIFVIAGIIGAALFAALFFMWRRYRHGESLLPTLPSLSDCCASLWGRSETYATNNGGGASVQLNAVADDQYQGNPDFEEPADLNGSQNNIRGQVDDEVDRFVINRNGFA